MTEDRSEGVDFSDLDELEDHDYPASPEEIIEQYGDKTVEYENGEESLGYIVENVGIDQFESAEEIYETVMMFVGEGATGEGHSGRGAGTATDEEGTETF